MLSEDLAAVDANLHPSATSTASLQDDLSGACGPACLLGCRQRHKEQTSGRYCSFEDTDIRPLGLPFIVGSFESYRQAEGVESLGQGGQARNLCVVGSRGSGSSARAYFCSIPGRGNMDERHQAQARIRLLSGAGCGSVVIVFLSLLMVEMPRAA